MMNKIKKVKDVKKLIKDATKKAQEEKEKNIKRKDDGWKSEIPIIER